MGQSLKTLQTQIELMHEGTSLYGEQLTTHLANLSNTLSMNISSMINLKQHVDDTKTELLEQLPEEVAKKRGRPKGSKNKPKST